MNKLHKTKENIIDEYFDLQDKFEFAKELAALCRALDNMYILSGNEEQFLNAEAEFYSTFVDFVKKYAK